MIWRHDPSNASSRQDKSRTACLAKNNPVLNCAEALNLLLRSHRLAGGHPSWKRREQRRQPDRTDYGRCMMSNWRFLKHLLTACFLLALAVGAASRIRLGRRGSRDHRPDRGALPRSRWPRQGADPARSGYRHLDRRRHRERGDMGRQIPGQRPRHDQDAVSRDTVVALCRHRTRRTEGCLSVLRPSGPPLRALQPPEGRHELASRTRWINSRPRLAIGPPLPPSSFWHSSSYHSWSAICTGRSMQPTITTRVHGYAGFIRKPFRLATVTQLVTSVLARSSTSTSC
jgi:hypothetical protein